VILGRQRSPENHEGPNLRPYVRAANITWEGWDLSDVKQMNFDERDFKRFKLHPGDVLINEGSGSADEVGKPAIWNGEIKNCCFQNTLIAVRPHATTSEYLYFVLLNAALSKAFVDEARGVNIHHIGRAGLAQFPIPVPPSEEQQEIVRRIKAAFKVIDKVEEETSRATQLLDRLDRATLEKAFRGELVLSLQTASTVMANSE
jgi:type I restriction enzyme S subunit